MSLFEYLVKEIHNLALWFLISIFTSLPAVFQDLILNNFQSLRHHILSSLRDRFAATLATAARYPLPDAPLSFEALDYYVDPAAAHLLKFSALHAVSANFQEQTGDPLPPTQLLPNMSTVLLQTEEEKGGEQYLEAVAASLAAQMQGVLLPVDTILLSSLLSEILGGSPEDYIPLFTTQDTTRGNNIGRKRGGTTKSGRKLKLAWEALQQGLAHRQTPIVVYIKAADVFLCSSWERYDAFTTVFGSSGGSSNTINSSIGVGKHLAELNQSSSPRTHSPSSSSRNETGGSGTGTANIGGPIVILGGAILSERGAGLIAGNTANGTRNAGEEVAGSMGRSDPFPSSGLFGGGGLGDEGPFSPSSSLGGGGFGGLDGGYGDDLGSLASVLLNLNRLMEEPRPNSRKLLAAAFPTRVKLLSPPPGSAAATRHRARVQRDVEKQVEKDNYSRASAVAAATGVTVPPRGSEIYSAAATASAGGGFGGFGSGAGLSKEAWEKVLAWAVSIETLQNKKNEMEITQALSNTPTAITDSGENLSNNGTISNGNGVHSSQTELKGDGITVLPAAEERKIGDRRQRLRQQQQQQDRQSAALPFSGLKRVFSAVSTREEYYADDITKESLLGAPIPMPSLSPSETKKQRQVLSSSSGNIVDIFLSFSLVGENVLQKIPGGQLAVHTLHTIYNIAKSILEKHINALQPAVSSKKNDAITTPVPVTATELTKNNPMEEGLNQFPPLKLNESSLRYGLTMLRQSSGGPRATVQPENSYEKQLLSEVLSPEDLGAGKGGSTTDTPAGFSNVGALEEAKRVLQETVQLPLQRPELFQTGALAKPPSGVLLFGPPGTGKTLLARSTAAESGASFLELSLSSLSSKYYGDSTKLVRAAFTLAEKLAPCVLFIDEVDALLGRRSSTGREHEATRELKNEFMSRWDSIRTRGGGTGWVMVLGATNRPFDLDEAVLRRFSVRVAVELPDKKSRRDILNVILAGQPMEESVDVDKIAEETEGFSGSDLRQLCVAAAMRPIRELVKGTTGANASTNSIDKEENDSEQQSALNPLRNTPTTSTNASEQQMTTPLNSKINLISGSGVHLPSPQLVSAFNDATHLAQGGTVGAAAGGLFGFNSTAAGGAASQKPRPVNQADFEAARRDVGPTVDNDSSVIQELKEWDKKFGSVGGARKKGGAGDSRLLYYT